MTAVMCFKVKTDKDSIKTLAYQVAQITTACVHKNVKIIDAIITFGGEKDIVRELKKIDCRKRVDYLIIYSRSQIGLSETEMLSFMDQIENEYNTKVVCLRSPQS
jgi:hypothetical protein